MQESMLMNNGFEQSYIGMNSSAFDEKIIEECDSHWDDIIAQLSISRMVNDSIVKGIVEDAADRIAEKEAEIASLLEKLQDYEGDVTASNNFEEESFIRSNNIMVIPYETELDLDTSCYLNHVKHLRFEFEEQIQLLNNYVERMQKSVFASRLDTGLCKACPEEKENISEWLREITQTVDVLKDVLVAGFDQINQSICSKDSLPAALQWMHELQSEINSSLVQDYIRDLQEEYETRLYEHKVSEKNWKENWETKATELKELHSELHVILEELNSHEKTEKGNVLKRKDQFRIKSLGDDILSSQSMENIEDKLKTSDDSGDDVLDIADLPHLKQMPKEDLISYFKSEMTNMKRRHESILQEKTEEFFKLYRKLLNEKGSSPFRKDKEFGNLKAKLQKIISSLDKILVEKEISHLISNGDDRLGSFREKLNLLYSENKWLKCLLVKKTKEIVQVQSHISIQANQKFLHPSVEAKYLKQIRKLEMDLENTRLESTLRNDLHRIILKELVGKHTHSVQDMKVDCEYLLDMYNIIFKEIVSDVMCSISSIVSKVYVEKKSVEALLYERDKVLKLEIEDKMRLKQELTSLLTIMKQKEKFASEAESELMKEKKQLDQLQQELYMLREKFKKQEDQISDFQQQSTSMNARLKDNVQKFQQYELEIGNLNSQLKSANNSLEESDKQNTMLQQMIYHYKHEIDGLNEKLKVTSDALEGSEKEKNVLSLSTQKYEEQQRHLKFILISALQLFNSFKDLESQLAKSMERNESRMKILSNQFRPLIEQASIQKQVLKIRCSDLQKAEAEVDLLGDEVEELYDLLGRMYLALDHYSPVLQHYPGIMEILKLVRGQLKGEND